MVLVDIDRQNRSRSLYLGSVSKTFGSRLILDGITLDIEDGSFTAIIGPSGCGKSTLLRMMARLETPDSGNVSYEDPRLQGTPPGSLTMVFQEPVLMPWRTAIDNVALPLQIQGMSARHAKQIAQHKLKEVGLNQHGGDRPHQLSGGMRQRVAIARALITDPALILMDEPFGALDDLTRIELNGYLLGLWEQLASTIVLVTHSVPEAVLMADSVVVMGAHPGRILQRINIPLPHPRHRDMRYTPEFSRIVDKISRVLEEASTAAWHAVEGGAM